MFLENTWRYVRGYINIKVEGFFTERFINLCMNKNIELWNVKKINEAEIVASIKYKDYKKVEEISEITKTRLIKNYAKGIPDLTIRYKKRKMFIGIFFFVFLCVYIYSSRIWQIEIVGDFRIPIEELWNELKIEGVKNGIKKSDLDYDKIKNNIYVRRNDVAWMGFTIKGTKAYVEVVERNNREIDELKNVPCNVISEKDGVIYKIIVKNGKKQVNVGDFVTKDQVLISGNLSEEKLVHADGEVYIKTWYTNKVNMPYEKDLVNKTGNKEKKYKLEIGNCKINLINNDTKFEKYDTITVSNKLKIFNRFELPIKLTELTYEEIKIDTVKYTEAQAENIAKREAINGVKQKIKGTDDSNYENSFKIIKNEDSISVEVTVECIEKVGIKQKIEH